MQRDHVLKYRVALEQAKLLVVVHGAAPALETAQRVMGDNDGQDVTIHRAA